MFVCALVAFWGQTQAWNSGPSRAVHRFAIECLCVRPYYCSCCRLVEPIEFLPRASGLGLGAEEKLVSLDSKRRRKPGDEPPKVLTVWPHICTFDDAYTSAVSNSSQGWFVSYCSLHTFPRATLWQQCYVIQC